MILFRELFPSLYWRATTCLKSYNDLTYGGIFLVYLQLVLERGDLLFNILINCSDEINGLRLQKKYIAGISASK